ncbi:hypothetical protein RS9916_32437 [Synechococcus sp. RS9916]|nr:hypothetical protein RS9916_32437 [Synechococcus sp. RS9916]
MADGVAMGMDEPMTKPYGCLKPDATCLDDGRASKSWFPN